MKVISWNMGAAFGQSLANRRKGWEWLRLCGADVLLLQEAVVPDWAATEWPVVVHHRMYEHTSVPWGTAVLTRLPGYREFNVTGEYPWIRALHGSVVVVEPEAAGAPWLVSIHSNSGPIPAEKLSRIDHSKVARCSDRGVWEVEVAAHELSQLLADQSFVFGGDLNSSLLIDEKSGYDANQVLFQNLLAYGFHDVRTPPAPDPEPQTYFKARNGPFQLDYLFVHDGSQADGWKVHAKVSRDAGVSDHAPIEVTLLATGPGVPPELP